MSLKEVGCQTWEGKSTKDEQKEQRKEILDSLKDALRGAFQEHWYLVKESVDGSIWNWRGDNLRKSAYRVDDYLQYTLKQRQEELNLIDVKKGLNFLSKVLYTHFGKKVIILIDECDAPITQALIEDMDDKVLKYLIKCISSLMSATLKGTDDYVERALMNSCIRISGICSYELNNREDILFLQNPNFSKLYGFTEEEVDKLFEKVEFQALKDSHGIRKWYDGYRVLDDEETRIYNSWSIINYLSKSVQNQKKVFNSYWAESSYVHILGKLFVKPEIQKRIEKLLKDETIKIAITKPTADNILKLKKTIHDSQNMLDNKEVDFFLQLLWDDGLLNAQDVRNNGSTVTLKIPNHEIKTEIINQCYTTSLFKRKYQFESENIIRYIQALECLLVQGKDHDEPTDGESSSDIHTSHKGMLELANAVSALFSNGAVIPQNESELHHILFYLAFQNKDLDVQANRAAVQIVSEEVEAGGTKRGRKPEFDILVTLGEVGIILELKILKISSGSSSIVRASKEALNQIFDREYYRAFENYQHKDVKKKIYVGLCFSMDKKVAIHYLVDSTNVTEAKFVKSRLTE